MWIIKPILIFLATVSANAKTYEKDEGVYVLTESNFDNAVKEFEFLLVEFYAPWCGHCKALAPEYVKAAQLLKEADSNIKLAKIDGTEETSMIEKHAVKGYPTLRFYRNGEYIKYNGGRMAAEIVAWLEKKTGPSATTLANLDEARDFIHANDVAVIGFFKDQKSEIAQKYLNAVKDYEVYPMAITSDEKVFEKYKAADDSVILFKDFDEGRAAYEGAIDKEQLLQFVERYALPLVVEFNHDTAQKIFKGLIKSHFLLFANKSSEDYDKQHEILKTLAKEYRHKMIFVLINTEEDDNRRVVDFLGLKKDKFPTFRIIRMLDDIMKYKPEKSEIEEANLKAFIEEYLEGKIPLHLKTEELPDDWNSNSTKYLTGKNFDEIAFDKTKNVLVEFHAPWCGHCKQLAPIWDEVAESLSEKTDVVVAKIDATENELSHSKVRSFPTIKLYKKDTNEAVEYNGERTKEGILKFLNTDGVYGLAAPDHDEL